MKQKNAFSARTCIVVVVVTHEFNMASYFPEVGNLNGSNNDICSDVAGPSISGSGDFFFFFLSFQIDHRSRTFTVLPQLVLPAAIWDLGVTNTTILAFQACYVIMHSKGRRAGKVYYLHIL